MAGVLNSRFWISWECNLRLDDLSTFNPSVCHPVLWNPGQTRPFPLMSCQSFGRGDLLSSACLLKSLWSLVYVACGCRGFFLTTLVAWLWEWQCWSVCRSVCHFGAEWNSSTTIGWIAMGICTGIHDPQRMNPNDFGDPLTFPLAPPQGSNLWFWVKCLSSYWMGCPKIWHRHSCPPQDEL